MRRSHLAPLLALFVTMLLLLPIPSQARPLPADADDPPLVGTTISSFGGAAATVATRGTTAYVGVGTALQAFDVSNPTQPVRLGSAAVPGDIWAIAISGSFAYVAAAAGGLRVFDLANPGQPVEVGGLVSSEMVLAVAISGSYAYVAAGKQVLVLDIADPANPLPVGSFTPPSVGPATTVGSVVVIGSSAYVAVQPSVNPGGVYILDISSPQALRQIGFIPSSYHLYPLATMGSFLLVPDSNVMPDSGLKVFDVSDPVNPVQLGHIALSVNNIAVSGNMVYVTAAEIVDIFLGPSKLYTLDLSDPTAPRIVNAYGPPGLARNQIALAGGYVLLANWNQGLELVDMSAAPPKAVGRYLPPVGGLNDLALANTTAYLVAHDSGLHVADVSAPRAPRIISSAAISGTLGNIAVAGDFAYLTTHEGELVIVDVAKGTSPREAGRLRIGKCTPYDVAAADGYIYVLCGNELVIVDAKRPATPVVGRFSMAFGGGRQIAVSGGYAYVAAYYAGLVVIDVSEPRHPTQAASYLPPTQSVDAHPSVEGIQVVGRHAYMSYQVLGPNQPTTSGLQVLDISNPRALAVKGEYSDLGAPLAYQPADGFMYFARGQELVVASADANSGALTRRGATRLPGQQGAALPGGLFLAATQRNGLVTLRFAPFSIAGLVTQANGLPYAGAAVTVGGDPARLADDGPQVVTGADGSYTITDLDASGYLLTPSAASAAFWPPRRSVALRPTLGQQNFVALPQPVAATVAPGLATSLTLTDTQGLTLRLDIPAGAFSQTQALTLTSALESDGGGVAFAGHAFTLAAGEALTFGRALSLTLHYSAADVRTVSDKGALMLRWWSGDAWLDASAGCDGVNQPQQEAAEDVVRVSICRAGRYALFGPTNQLALPLVASATP
jgi:hypothetical protein